MFFEICSTEMKKSLLYDHINSKEHKDIEDFFNVKGLIYCELCEKEKHYEWREHINSKKHLELQEKTLEKFVTWNTIFFLVLQDITIMKVPI